ncbi:hypothetical protein [Lutibacter sp. B1]|uniref:hypothetical protein n=1 Tax=Lutibacter sp. B1 TaxID=2725996 RepID=UPI00145652AE|nr:hypothetical protein [Lutibacter sp. B1]NLP58665.1 hypothetical protein [Lutibacter sp. B1]
MKTLKKIITVLILMFALNGFSQEQPTDVVKTTTTKNFYFEKDGKQIPFRIKVFENSTHKIKFEKEDKNKVNQDVVKTPEYVTKLIFVDNDVDKSYDRYIVLRYQKDSNDSFELVPTDNGFGVKVDEKYIEYIIGKGAYYVDNKDHDFFIVDEFNVID